MKLVHLADLHLGYRAYNKLDKNGINIREKDILRSFKESLDKISEIQPDIILMAGDIFHKPRPSNMTIYSTIILLNQFREKCKSPIIMIAGNHEAFKTLESGSVLRIFENSIPNIIVADYNVEKINLDNLNISILCIPHGGLAQLEEFNLIPDKDYKYNIMMIHGTYENCPEISGYGNGSLIKESYLNQSQWDYIAFGHYHKFTELASNTFYSGAIDRTTTNIWQEANDQKGFIEFDLDTKNWKFHPLNNLRKVIDIKRIDAKNLTGEEINEKIEEEIQKISDLDKSIVRITIENIDNVAIKELDYKKIREYKKAALHFRLNLIKKENMKLSITQGDPSEKRSGIIDYLEEELIKFEFSQGIDKEKIDKLAKEYLETGVSV